MHHRLTAPLGVKIQGRLYRTVDWSLGGVRIQDEGQCKGLSNTQAVLIVPFQGMEIRLPVKLKYERSAEFGQHTVFSFVDLGERQHETLKLFVDELVKGSMIPAEDMINRLDVPTTPVLMIDKQKPAGNLPWYRRNPRTWVFTALYLLAGLALTLWLAMLVYVNVFKMEIQTARLETPLQLQNTAIDKAEAFVTQGQALQLRVGDTAEVYVPTLRMRVQTQIRRIEPLTFVQGGIPLLSNQRLLVAKVQMSLDAATANKIKARIENPAGLPIVVLFNRHRPLGMWWRR
jgi:hypothetical protein